LNQLYLKHLNDPNYQHDESRELQAWNYNAVSRTIVTAASSNHFKTLWELVKSVKYWEPRVRLVVYTFDTSPEQNQKLAAYWSNIVIRKFDYSKYPAWYNITEQRGQYAWKIAIIDETIKAFGGLILWLDAGDRVKYGLYDNIWRQITDYGIWSSWTSGSIREWIHSGTVQSLGLDSKHLDRHMCNGAIIGINTLDWRVNRDIVKPMVACSLDKDCIAPTGSDRYNHRQDQSKSSVKSVHDHRG